ncbi:Glycosyl transferase [Flavobacterium sp. 9AF]|uniref:glycosyltransferase family 2 protein n=1 Tax=Flavobacterium sp. 9AF TaxID=2653142 RepID=UPI0012F069E7|nr:glycosyltransferase [Flavobacterium sp. 9AF]VXB18098.1 Glycosyl transferase [Flavobacterium sp. 9AF]
MKISIITITYNRANLIGETIESVLNQTYQNFEHIIIDDGSTDNTEEVVKGYNDERILYFNYQKTSNLSTLRNYGLKHSSGDIISILDSDDLWLNNKLELIINIFKKNNEIKVITHNIKYFKNINSPKKEYYNYESDFFKNILYEAMMFKILPFPIIIFKKEILNEITFLNNFYKEGLQDFLFRVAANYKVYFIAKPLTLMRLHNGNTHSNIKNIPYYSNYFFSTTKLLLNRKINLNLFINGNYLNLKNLIKYLIK